MSIDQKLLDRINELSRKKKTVGLTEEEASERQALHKAGFEQQLNSLTFIDPEGNDVTPQKIKDKRVN